ncbi:MAG TPA: transglutaminase-like domain-containing protein [Chloroflexota bacterium]|nr:transglutaminase-like domain-containing protein [Chloroflexota bacterium]
MTASEARARFAALVAASDDALDLGYAALWLAAEEYPGLDVEAYASRFDALASAVAARPLSAPPPDGRLRVLNGYLFDELGFRGNAADYYDPRNSFLNEVLDRRIGIPITLAVVHLEVGWRLGLPLAGVGMPGHFLVGYYPPGAPPQYIDVFAGGLVLDQAACAARLRAQFGGFAPRDEHFAPVSKRQILARMLTNLKHIYAERGDWQRALAAIERLLLVQPGALGELRDRGLVHLRRGDLRAARRDLRRYLELAPQAPDAAAIEQELAQADNLWARRN